uniref:Uncharacterized protein n=1 Tax=Phytophthora ramorum TaxID=164328 RepID=H3GUS1_PHYRM
MTSCLHVSSCRFLRLGCRNDQHELFSASYARSNKKRTAKLLRCFPHCCPDHVPRSYCGCSLHVLVTFASVVEAAMAYADEDVVVCARFEATAAVAVSGSGEVVTAMPTDAIVALPESALQTSGNSSLENDWGRAEKAGELYQRQFPENTVLYVLNNHRNPQWYYGYESGSTKAQRELKHVLAAKGARLANDSPTKSDVTQRITDPSALGVSGTAALPDEDKWKSDAASFPGRQAEPSPLSLAPSLGLPSPRQTLGCPICSGSLTLPSHTLHPDTMEKLQPLLLLRLFLRFVPLDAFAFYFTPMDFRIQRRWLAKIPPSSRAQPNAAAYTLVADVASAFSLKNFLAGPPQPGTLVVSDPAREQMVLRSCADLLLDAFSSQRVQQILTAAIKISATNQEVEAAASTCTPTGVASCEQFSQLVADLYEELAQLVAARYTNSSQFDDRHPVGHAGEHVSVLALVDDILSLVYAEPKYRSLRQDASALLLRKGSTLGVTVQTLFRAFMTQQQQTRGASWCRSWSAGEREVKSASTPLTAGDGEVDGVSLQQDGNSSRMSRLNVLAGDILRQPQRNSCVDWNRRWFLVPTSVFISPLIPNTDGGGSGPSLLFVVAFLRLLASVDVLVEGNQVVVKAATAETTTLQRSPGAGTVLQLDGEVHAFQSLPNGLSGAAGAAMFGDCWGLREYEGRVADDGAALELTLLGLPPVATSTQPLDVGSMPLPATGTMETVYRVRLRVALTEDENGGEDYLSVFTEVSSAWCLAASTLTSSKNVSAPSWCQILEMDSTYIGLTTDLNPEVNTSSVR